MFPLSSAVPIARDAADFVACGDALEAEADAILVDEREHLLVDERDRGLDRVRRGDAETERVAENEAQLVRVHHIRRVGDGDKDRLVRLDRDGSAV
jgi:hypothetical protein